MKNGFIKAAALTPKVKVADTTYNKERICELIGDAALTGAQIMVFPELCITGYTCGDLFAQELLLTEARKALIEIAEYTEKIDGIVFVGLPFAYDAKLYNVAAVLSGGSILGLVPKTHIPNYNEFYERRYFEEGFASPVPVRIDDDHIVPMGTDLIFGCRTMPDLKIAVEICEDLWAPAPPSIRHAMAGATVIVNLSASDETTGKDIYRRDLVSGQSARLICGYIYACAGDGESTTDVVYAGHNLIAENGIVLKESQRFINESIFSEIDVQRLTEERRRMSTYDRSDAVYITVEFHLKEKVTELTRFVDPAPFVPGKQADREKRCEEIFMIQAMGLKKRLEHTNAAAAIIGISGGLDSTLALLVVAKAFDLLGKDRKDIITVTMPGFGTSDRTHENAVALTDSLGSTLKEIPITEAVHVHFRDIGKNEEERDVTYENGQARERTQILMDLANLTGGLVVGTGDMSELALGWATYNGDHMSMYGVNASVPKTLVRHLVRYYADTCGDERLKGVLLDILETPVSPELLPPEDGVISQKTEDIVGPYELHDFFLYYMLRFGCTPRKIYRLAVYAFAGAYRAEEIEKWLTTFYRRFFSQQFKRSCLPDGPKVGTVALSPRGDLRMPSDACVRIWMDDLLKLHEETAGESGQSDDTDEEEWLDDFDENAGQDGAGADAGQDDAGTDAVRDTSAGKLQDSDIERIDKELAELDRELEEFDKEFDKLFKDFL